MTEEMRNFLHAVDVIARVRGRLQAAGAFRELGIMRGLSVDELDLLVRLELGLDFDRSKNEDDWKKIGEFSLTVTPAATVEAPFSPLSPQVPCETVAA